MRKRISGLMAFICLLVAAASALAAGTTVTTFTPFADMDFAAQGYMDLITAWEDETGNMVEDYSGLEDDLFMEQMQEMVTAGRADLVVVPLGSGLTKDQLVSVDELLAAAPDCGAKRMDAMAERDGSVLLAPVRFNWEALYVNTDVLEANGVAVPTNYDELIIACASLAQKGILPLANAMCEWPDIVTGVALALLFAFAGTILKTNSVLGFWTLLIAHITFNLPYVILNVMPKLQQMDKDLVEAALDLGCTPFQSFTKVVIHEIMPGIISGALMAFTMSLDDFVISYFVTGSSFITLPVEIYNYTKKPIQPKIYALFTLMFIVILVLMVVMNLLQAKSEKNRQQPRRARV